MPKPARLGLSVWSLQWTRPAWAEKMGEPLSPSGKERQGYPSLEARPEAEFPAQGRIGATTPRTPYVGPTAARRIAVPQVRQVDIAPQRNGNVPRYANVKVGIERPQYRAANSGAKAASNTVVSSIALYMYQALIS
jgi:hypothetical protein